MGSASLTGYGAFIRVVSSLFPRLTRHGVRKHGYLSPASLSPLLPHCPSTSPALPASGESERYLQRSRVPTLHFQPSLPRLPVPRLSDTCQRYLAALRPVVSDQQFLHTQNIVKEFEKEGGEGHGRWFSGEEVRGQEDV